MELTEPAVKKNSGKRLTSIKYFIGLEHGTKLRVCQSTMTQTFKVTKRRLQMIYEKIKFNIDLNDQRGKHANRPHKIAETEKEQIREHIKSFPCEISHYGRNTSKKNCLHPALSIQRMYHLYLEKYENSKITYFTYREIFNTDFNLRFGTPRSDTCKYCDKLFNKMIACENEEEYKKLETETNLHHRKAEKAYATLALEQENANENNIVLCVDMQQVIFTPNLTHSDVFYKRQYANYNFCVKDFHRDQSEMFVWHESIAGRGSMEIASCVFKFITNHYTPLGPGEFRKLTMWSDRCVGQNNNWTMIALFGLMIKNKYFSEINQKFLVSGHSFLPCDRDFAIIEKYKKTQKLHVPKDVKEMIETSKITSKFIVNEMNQIDFYDFGLLLQNLKKQKDLKITEAKWMQFCNDDPKTLKFRKTHNIMEAWQNFQYIKTSNMIDFGSVQLLQKYKEPIPVKTEKLKDLKELAVFLPNDAKLFYDNLI